MRHDTAAMRVYSVSAATPMDDADYSDERHCFYRAGKQHACAEYYFTYALALYYE